MAWHNVLCDKRPHRHYRFGNIRHTKSATLITNISHNSTLALGVPICFNRIAQAHSSGTQKPAKPDAMFAAHPVSRVTLPACCPPGSSPLLARVSLPARFARPVCRVARVVCVVAERERARTASLYL